MFITTKVLCIYVLKLYLFYFILFIYIFFIKYILVFSKELTWLIIILCEAYYFYTAIMTINVFWQLNVLAHSTRYKIFSRWYFEVYIYFLKTDFGISYKLPANDLTISECLNQENIYLFYLPYFYILFYFYLFVLFYFYFIFIYLLLLCQRLPGKMS